MSHTTRVSGVQLTNLDAIRNAVAQMVADGAKISLVENAVPRAYFTNQEGMTTPAALVIRVDGDRSYDVGLYLEGNTYEPRFDVYGGSIEAQIGAAKGTYENSADPRRTIGKFLQEYQIAVVMQAAINNGNMLTRQVGSKGDVNLVVTGY